MWLLSSTVRVRTIKNNIRLFVGRWLNLLTDGMNTTTAAIFLFTSAVDANDGGTNCHEFGNLSFVYPSAHMFGRDFRVLFSPRSFVIEKICLLISIDSGIHRNNSHKCVCIGTRFYTKHYQCHDGQSSYDVSLYNNEIVETPYQKSTLFYWNQLTHLLPKVWRYIWTVPHHLSICFSSFYNLTVFLFQTLNRKDDNSDYLFCIDRYDAKNNNNNKNIKKRIYDECGRCGQFTNGTYIQYVPTIYFCNVI